LEETEKWQQKTLNEKMGQERGVRLNPHVKYGGATSRGGIESPGNLRAEEDRSPAVTSFYIK